MIPDPRPIIRAKLSPPRIPRHTLHRPRLTERLLQASAYRLTILQAGPGYGKSTALAMLSRRPDPLIWYQVDAADRDPQRFLAHLLQGFAEIEPELAGAPAALLTEGAPAAHFDAWTGVIDALTNALSAHRSGSIYLVLDDAHRLNDSAAMMRLLDWLIGRAPPHLHILLSTRFPLQLPHLLHWRVRGELQEIGQAELAFNALEIARFFGEQAGASLTPSQSEQIAARTEGWAIALNLILRQLTGRPPVEFADALARLSAGEGDLFSYLAHEVLADLPEDVSAFMRVTSILRELDAPACDYLRRQQDSDAILRHLEENSLFVVQLGPGQLRYHPLFRDLLSSQLSPLEAQAAHNRAAAYYRALDDEEAAIHHLLAAGSYSDAAGLIVQAGRKWVRRGRLDMLAGWVAALPPESLESRPMLLSLLGDVARLHSHFEEALAWYQQAEARARAQHDLHTAGQALRGQARVYLDTVNPSKADELLQEALRLSDGQESRESRAHLLELLAENLLNRGQMDAAHRYQEQARALLEEGPSQEELSVRLLIRTGRLAEARRVLEERAAAERAAPVQRPRAHRETLLLLSLIMAFQGEQAAALRAAEEGTRRGLELASPFITAVGHMRQGHAWLLDKDLPGYERAIACFQEAIAISEALMVPRLRVEAGWGLAQAHGFRGELEQAVAIAGQSIAIAREAGDEWIEGLVRTVVGAAHVLAGDLPAAHHWLDQAGAIFQEVRDTFGESAVRLWRCLAWLQAGEIGRAQAGVADLLRRVRENDYAFLFQASTLLGPPDERALIPLLILARDSGREAPYARELLARLGLPGIERHPGYQLRVQTLGDFRLWRGRQEVEQAEWQRRKARDLFLLLLTYRGRLLEREQITEMLWPGLDPDEAERDFKVAYNQVARVLEPDRKRNAPSAYIMRDGSSYGLRAAADLRVDADGFLALVAAGDGQHAADPAASLPPYRQALALYQGEYLQAMPYAEWCSEERERLLTTYLRVAERVAQLSLDQGEWEAVIQVCRQILARDDCWESAYRMMMVAYARQGNRTQAMRVYQRCAARLQAELGVEPSPATKELLASLTAGL